MLLVLASVLMTATSLIPTNLECEALVNPMGMDVQIPRLSWRVESQIVV